MINNDSNQIYDKIISIEDKKDNNESVICYICKRKFPSLEKLIKHEQLSDLHKVNIK